MKVPMTTVVVSLLVKPAVLVGLFELINRVAEFSGFGLSLIMPAADSVSQVTGFSYNDSMVLVTGLIAFCVLQLVTAVWGVLRAPASDLLG
jgi:hypothetical protein